MKVDPSRGSLFFVWLKLDLYNHLHRPYVNKLKSLTDKMLEFRQD